VLLTFLGVIERWLFRIFPDSVCNGIHIDNVIAIIVRRQCAIESLTILPDVEALCIGQEVLHVAV
jgi:hypothetical protein